MSGEQTSPARRRFVVYLPLILFGALALLFLIRLFAGDPQKLPSALVGKPAPATELPGLPGLAAAGKPVPGLVAGGSSPDVVVLNVFASWCLPCRDEHPALIRLAEMMKGRPVRIVGLNYKDRPDAALRFLTELGNPYGAVGVDPAGRAGIEWGVYGVPETFIVGRDGRIAYKLVGPISPEKLATVVVPEIEKALR